MPVSAGAANAIRIQNLIEPYLFGVSRDSTFRRPNMRGLCYIHVAYTHMPEFATHLPYSRCMRVARSRLQHRIAGVIRRHREGHRWTQEAFADHIEMHRAQYGLVERGGSKDIQLSTLERIAAGLGESVWTLVREAEES